MLFLYFKKYVYIIFETEQNCVFIKKKKENRTVWKTLGPMFDLPIYHSAKAHRILIIVISSSHGAAHTMRHFLILSLM